MTKLKILVLDGRMLKTVLEILTKVYGQNAEITGINYWEKQKIPNKQFDITFLQASLTIANTPFSKGKQQQVFNLADFIEKYHCKIVGVSSHQEWLQRLQPHINAVLRREQMGHPKTLLEFLSTSRLI